jgi:hypothetical protein
LRLEVEIKAGASTTGHEHKGWKPPTGPSTLVDDRGALAYQLAAAPNLHKL